MSGKSGIAVRNVQRANAAAVAQALARFGVATIHEAMGRTGLLAPYMRPIYPGARCAVPRSRRSDIRATTGCCTWPRKCSSPATWWSMALSSPDDHGFFGDLLATSFRARGGLGLIIDAGVRDISELQPMKFPVWSKVVHAKGTIKAKVGSVNVPVICAGALVTSRRCHRR